MILGAWPIVDDERGRGVKRELNGRLYGILGSANGIRCLITTVMDNVWGHPSHEEAMESNGL